MKVYETCKVDGKFGANEYHQAKVVLLVPKESKGIFTGSVYLPRTTEKIHQLLRVHHPGLVAIAAPEEVLQESWFKNSPIGSKVYELEFFDGFNREVERTLRASILHDSFSAFSQTRRYVENEGICPATAKTVESEGPDTPKTS